MINYRPYSFRKCQNDRTLRFIFLWSFYTSAPLSLQKDEKYIFQCQFNVSTSIWVLSSLIFEQNMKKNWTKWNKGGIFSSGIFSIYQWHFFQWHFFRWHIFRWHFFRWHFFLHSCIQVHHSWECQHILQHSWSYLLWDTCLSVGGQTDMGDVLYFQISQINR